MPDTLCYVSQKASDELLPCPFCGCEKISFFWIGNHWSVRCSECNAVQGGETLQEATGKWNRRAKVTDKNLSDKELFVFVRQEVLGLENGNEETARKLAQKFRDMGFQKNAHLRYNGQFTWRLVMEWYIGQFLDIVDKEAWFAINSWINAADKYGVPSDE